MKGRNLKSLNYAILLLLVLVFSLTLPCSAENKTYKWRIGTLVPESTALGAGMYEFAKLVEERTDGQIKMDCYPVQQLGFWMDEFDNIAKGTQEMGFIPISSRYPQIAGIYQLFLVSSWDDFHKAYDKGGFLYNYIDKFCKEVGVKLLGTQCIGFESYSGTKGPVVYPEDIKKLKIKTRVQQSASKIYFEKLGPVVNIDMGEVFTALQLGTIDCQADQAVETVYTQFRDVTKYFTDLNTNAACCELIMNEKLWDSLSPKLQKIIQETGDEINSKITSASQQNEEMYYQKFEEEGVVVTRLTPEQRECWLKLATEPGGSWDSSRELYGDDLIDFLLENIVK